MLSKYLCSLRNQCVLGLWLILQSNAVSEKDTLFPSLYLNQLLKIICPLWVITKMFGGGCSVAKSCLTLCDPMDCSMPGLPVPYYLPEFAQDHVHWVSDAIQPSHPLFSPILLLPSIFPASGSFPVSWLFTSGSPSIGASTSASVLPMSFQGWFPLELTSLKSLQSSGLSGVFCTCVCSIAAVTSDSLQPYGL